MVSFGGKTNVLCKEGTYISYQPWTQYDLRAVFKIGLNLAANSTFLLKLKGRTRILNTIWKLRFKHDKCVLTGRQHNILPSPNLQKLKLKIY